MRDYTYVSDKLLLNKFKNKPQGENNIILAEFFNIEGCTLYTKKGKKDRKLLTPKQEYFDTDKKTRDSAYSALCDFLKVNNRPIRDMYICVPMSDRVIVPKNEFTPLDLYYKDPVIPVFNKEFNMVEITLSHKEEYDELCLYSLGKIFPTIDNEPNKMFFSSFCFCGMILHY